MEIDVDNLSDDEIIDKLSTETSELPLCHINPPETTKPSELLDRPIKSASVGAFCKLPVEIIHQIIQELDFQALCRVAKVSFGLRSLTESLPAYHDLMFDADARKSLVALATTGMMQHYSARLLDLLFRTESCKWCGDYGPYLYLLAAERVCFRCMKWNPALWSITPMEARGAFALSPLRARKLLKLRVAPGVYLDGRIYPTDKSRLQRLVSVRAAKELALKVHGSMDAIQAEASGHFFKSFDRESYKIFQGVALTPPAPEPDADDFARYGYRHRNIIKTIVPFPAMSKSHKVQNGLWCMGCEMVEKAYRNEKLTPDVMAQLKLEASSTDLQRYVIDNKTRAWSRGRFPRHVRSCLATTVMNIPIEPTSV